MEHRKRTILQPPDRRLQLLNAATWVFARRGYRHTGVSEIIARAGVARGTFYLYFESKHQIFLAILSAFHDQVAEALDRMAAHPATPADARRSLAADCTGWLQLFAAHRDAAIVVLREAPAIDARFEQSLLELRQTSLDHFAARFRHLQALRLASAEPSPELLARLQLGMFDEVIDTYVLRESDADLDAIAESLAAFIWKAISR